MTSRRASGIGAALNRDVPFTFRWNGSRVSAFDGDTVVSALLAGGHDVFSRSMKYHRPRGVLTADYWDPNCIVQVGPEPNVRGAHRLATPGMDVRAQNVWPSLRYDIKAANALVGRFLTPGFYYKTFMQPRLLWPAYERVLATFAPGGTVDLDAERPRCDTRFAHPDVLVAGGGPAGLAARWWRPGPVPTCCWSSTATPSVATCCGAVPTTGAGPRSWRRPFGPPASRC